MATLTDVKVLKSAEYVSIDIRGAGAATADRAGNVYAFDLVATDGANQVIQLSRTGVNDDASTVSYAPVTVPAGFPAKDYGIKNAAIRKVNGAFRVTFQYVIFTPDGKALKDVLACLSDVDVDMTVQGGGAPDDDSGILSRLDLIEHNAAALYDRVGAIEKGEAGETGTPQPPSGQTVVIPVGATRITFS